MTLFQTDAVIFLVNRVKYYPDIKIFVQVLNDH